MAEFNFNNYKKDTMKIVVNVVTDEGHEVDKVIHIKPPLAKDFKRHVYTYEEVKIDDGVYDLEAEILSYNIEGFKVKPEDVSVQPFSAVHAFMEAYFAWVGELKKQKN